MTTVAPQPTPPKTIFVCSQCRTVYEAWGTPDDVDEINACRTLGCVGKPRRNGR